MLGHAQNRQCPILGELPDDDWKALSIMYLEHSQNLPKYFLQKFTLPHHPMKNLESHPPPQEELRQIWRNYKYCTIVLIEM